MPSPVFVVSDVGLANTFPDPNYPNRVVINITEFEVGSAFGQPAQRTDTGLYGNLLFGPETPTTYQTLQGGGVDIVLTIPPDAGPFDYGEVAIYNEGPLGRTLFAHAVFDEPQTKYSSLETNVGSSEVFHALLRLEQSTAVFQINSLIDPTLISVDLWSDVVPPVLGLNPALPLTLVREKDPAGNTSLLHRADDNRWTVGTTYQPFKTTTVANATTTSVDVPASVFEATDLTSTNRKYVVEFSSGLFRSATNFVVAGANYRFNLNPAALPDIPQVGSAVRVYLSNSFPLQIPLATTTTPGIVRPGNGIALPSAGLFETYGLLHGVPGSGRQIGAGTNLNLTPADPGVLASGVYAIAQNDMPVGMVPGVDWPGHIVIQSFGDYVGQGGVAYRNINQFYHPAGSGQFGDAFGVGGLPIYWRSWNPNAGVWTNWFPFTIPGKVAPGQPAAPFLQAGQLAVAGGAQAVFTFPQAFASITAISLGTQGGFPGIFESTLRITGYSNAAVTIGNQYTGDTGGTRQPLTAHIIAYGTQQ